MIGPEYLGNIRNEMGFMVNGHPLPDPAVFTGAVSDLDTMGKRDATGYLHRNMVATKHPLKLEYHNIPWSLICYICGLIKEPQFEFTYTDPADGPLTFAAYVGDRSWEVVMAGEGNAHIGNLKFSVIQY